MKRVFSGSIPALATPFLGDRIDEAAFRSHVDWLIENGASGLVVCGTTGEAALLSIGERKRLIGICVAQAAGRVPVIAGCCAMATGGVLEQMHLAEIAGADAALIPAPPYLRPSQAGLFRHFETLAGGGGLPIILYDVPARTGVEMRVETVAALAAAFPARVVGIKDATGLIARVAMLRAACGAAFVQLSGNDETALAFMAAGGAGCISVTANVAPRLCADFQLACRTGDYRRALALNDRLAPLHRALFSDASPGPVKYALSLTRPRFGAEVRLPLTEPAASARSEVERALAHVADHGRIDPGA